MSIQSPERLLQKVYKAAQEKAGKEDGVLRAGHVLAAVRQIMQGQISEQDSDVAVFENLIRTICSLEDTQLRTPEIHAVVTALKRWENLTKTSSETKSAVRSVAGKFFQAHVPSKHLGTGKKYTQTS